MNQATTTPIVNTSAAWQTRPSDQQFSSLETLRANVGQRRRESFTSQVDISQVGVSVDEQQILLTAPNHRREEVTLEPTHWAFGQISQAAKAPVSYLRKLAEVPGEGAKLAGLNLQFGLQTLGRDQHLLMGRQNGSLEATALTSTSYGRIWDEDVVDAVQKANVNGDWKVPSQCAVSRRDDRATTLYASDRDVFIFLTDEQRPVEINGEQLFRGIMVWNSEVGSKSFGLATFLYRSICENRLIMGMSERDELRIRHTGGAPERFAREGAEFLEHYANQSAGYIEGKIAAAQNKEVGDDKKSLEGWLKNQGFTGNVAKEAVAKAEEEESQNPRSLWSMMQGITAVARGMNHSDSRVELERKAGKLIDKA